jgi:hypothetical protein
LKRRTVRCTHCALRPVTSATSSLDLPWAMSQIACQRVRSIESSASK